MIEKPYYLCTSPPCSCHGCWPTGSAVSAVATAGHCSGQGAIRIANLDHCAWGESVSTKYVRMCIRLLKLVAMRIPKLKFWMIRIWILKFKRSELKFGMIRIRILKFKRSELKFGMIRIRILKLVAMQVQNLKFWMIRIRIPNFRNKCIFV